jgi:hypothetical protein
MLPVGYRREVERALPTAPVLEEIQKMWLNYLQSYAVAPGVLPFPFGR